MMMARTRSRFAAVGVTAVLAACFSAFSDPSGAVVPGRNGKIVYTSYAGGDGEIWIMNGDGSKPTPLTNNALTDVDPAWSPDGTKIAYSSENVNIPPDPDYPERPRPLDIHVMNADGTNRTQLTGTPVPGYGLDGGQLDDKPTWSPDGTKIAYVSVGRFIVVMNVVQPHAWTTLASNAHYPTKLSWSPDGSRILYVSDAGCDAEIWVMNSNGSGQTAVTANSTNDEDPSWSPDGTSIVYCSQSGGDSEIWSMKADGSTPEQLTSNSVSDTEPSWSPNGQAISYVSTAGGDKEIWVMLADGSEPSPLTSNATDDFSPAWGVQPPAGAFTPVSPARVLDSRPAPDNVGVTPGKIPAGESVSFRLLVWAEFRPIRPLVLWC